MRMKKEYLTIFLGREREFFGISSNEIEIIILVLAKLHRVIQKDRDSILEL